MMKSRPENRARRSKYPVLNVEVNGTCNKLSNVAVAFIISFAKQRLPWPQPQALPFQQQPDQPIVSFLHLQAFPRPFLTLLVPMGIGIQTF